MKDKKEIFARAVILQGFDDRVVLEMDWGDNTRPIKEREEERVMMREWFSDKGYDSYMTEEEKAFFELPIGEKKFKKNELEMMDVRCKAMDIILWALQISELTDLTEYAIKNNHEVLNICREHNYLSEVEKYSLRSADELELQKDIEFLWNWRMNKVDIKATKGANHHITDMIEAEFGNRYDEAIKSISLYKPKIKTSSADFVTWNLVVRELYKWQILLLKGTTYWRYHTLCWILDDEMNWQEES